MEYGEDRIVSIKPNRVTIRNKAHMIFALEYLRTLDGKESYRAVYENPDKQPMSSAVARAGASRVLALESVQDYLDYIIYSELEIAGRVGVNPGRVVMELSRLAFGPSYKNPSVKLRALELLGRSMGILGDGELYEGLDRAKQLQIENYSRRVYEREQSKSSELSGPSEPGKPSEPDETSEPGGLSGPDSPSEPGE